jgi:penicillin-binding protein 2
VPLPQPAPPRITDNPNNLRAVQEGMMATMGPGGTGRAMAVGAPYLMAGKTGTAQKISRKGNQSFDPHSLPYHLRHQALFVGYAPADNPTIAVAISVEHGGFGGSTAAPIARKIFDAWLLGKMPDPVPTDPKYTRPPQPHAAPIGPAIPPAPGPVPTLLPAAGAAVPVANAAAAAMSAPPAGAGGGRSAQSGQTKPAPQPRPVPPQEPTR